MIVPKLDVSETDEAVEITAELPGVKEEEVDVSVTSNILTLKGEKSESREEKDKNYSLVERSYGSFTRSAPMTFDINPEDVSAEFGDGVLTIVIKKPRGNHRENELIRECDGADQNPLAAKNIAQAGAFAFAGWCVAWDV